MGKVKSTHEPQQYRHRRTVVTGIRYDGTPSCAQAIILWSDGKFMLDDYDRLCALTRDGLRYVHEGWTAMLGLLGEPYMIEPAVMELAYDVVASDPDYRAPLTLARVRELAGEAPTADLLRLRDIVAQLAAHCETTV